MTHVLYMYIRKRRDRDYHEGVCVQGDHGLNDCFKINIHCKQYKSPSQLRTAQQQRYSRLIK